VRRARFALGVALALAATSAVAVDTPAWPPSPETLARMRELQATISDPAASKSDRDSARRELERLLKAPDAPQGKTDAKRPARAAIDPVPGVAKQVEGRFPGDSAKEPPPTARLEVLDEPPRKPVANPLTGSLVQPTAPGIAVDPRTGRTLQETPAGYVDPRTGRVIPK
jgi:hypothetical protein